MRSWRRAASERKSLPPFLRFTGTFVVQESLPLFVSRPGIHIPKAPKDAIAAIRVALLTERNALWKTGATFSVAWGIPLLPLTPGGVRNGLATFLAGRYRTPEQHVSEVQSFDTILTSQVPDPATERSIRECVFERASAAVVQLIAF